MDFGHYLVEAHLKGPIGRFVSERPRSARSWIYKLLARYQEEGDAGLSPFHADRIVHRRR